MNLKFVQIVCSECTSDDTTTSESLFGLTAEGKVYRYDSGYREYGENTHPGWYPLPMTYKKGFD